MQDYEVRANARELIEKPTLEHIESLIGYDCEFVKEVLEKDAYVLKYVEDRLENRCSDDEMEEDIAEIDTVIERALLNRAEIPACQINRFTEYCFFMIEGTETRREVLKALFKDLNDSILKLKLWGSTKTVQRVKDLIDEEFELAILVGEVLGWDLIEGYDIHAKQDAAYRAKLWPRANP